MWISMDKGGLGIVGNLLDCGHSYGPLQVYALSHFHLKFRDA